MPLPRFAKLDREKRHLIVEAARKEFSAHPYKTASLNRIILAAGISKGSLYYYFDDKDDLFSTALSSWIGDLLDELEENIVSVSSARGFWAQAEKLITFMAKRLIENPGFMAMVAHGLQAKAQGQLKPNMNHIERRLTQGLNMVMLVGTELGALRTDLERSFMLKLAFAVARPSDEWLIASKDEKEAMARAKVIAKNYKRLFGA